MYDGTKYRNAWFTLQLESLLLFLDILDLYSIDELVQPRPESISSFGNLQLHDRNSTDSVSIGAKIRVIANTTIHIVASPAVALTRPDRGTLFRCRGITAREPHIRRLVELIFPNAGQQI
jgi:hypothetical protein